jgi:hypothetical protein
MVSDADRLSRMSTTAIVFGLGALGGAVILAVLVRLAIRHLRRFVRAFWPHS